MKSYYLQGRWEESRSTRQVINPWNGNVIDEVCLAEADAVERAVASCHEAFSQTRRQPAWRRAEILNDIATRLETRRREFVQSILAEAGKPVVLAEGEVDRAVVTFRLAAQQALENSDHGVSMDATPQGVGHLGWVRRFPLGVLLGITPFNFPLNLVAHKVAPCLATGNTMVLKPALKTPLTALLLAEVLHEAGVPPGQINVVPFDHEHIPSLLKGDRIKMLSFTGSAAVGWKLKSEAMRMKVALELGGNAAVVVEPDADWKAAVPMIASGAFGFAGQSCISVQRVLVHSSLYGDFRDAFVRHVQDKIQVGDPADRETMVGPMIDVAARDKVIQWIEAAQADGARALTSIRKDGRSLLGPVVLENVPPTDAVSQEEAFAPLAVLRPYDDFSEALAMVNASKYGLQAGIFTPDLNKAFQAYEELDVGGVLINQVPTFRVENMPYGGIKESGFGREGLSYAIEEMTEPRSLIIRRG